MKGLILDVTACIRCYPAGEPRAKCCCASNGFLPARLSQVLWFLGLMNGLVTLLLLFVTGVQFYYHFHNSITLRLLLDLKRSPGESLTMAQPETAWNLTNLLDTRLHALERARLVRRSEERYYPTMGGLFLAAVAQLTRAILR